MANEERLIDANALSDEVDKSKHNNPHPQGMIRVNHRNEHDHFLRMIHDAPTVDAVKVVRCKNCRSCYYNSMTEMGQCRKSGEVVLKEHFCSYGERREGE